METDTLLTIAVIVYFALAAYALRGVWVHGNRRADAIERRLNASREHVMLEILKENKDV